MKRDLRREGGVKSREGVVARVLHSRFSKKDHQSLYVVGCERL